MLAGKISQDDRVKISRANEMIDSNNIFFLLTFTVMQGRTRGVQDKLDVIYPSPLNELFFPMDFNINKIILFCFNLFFKCNIIISYVI